MKKLLMVSSTCAFISLTGCQTDDRRSSTEVYRETVIYHEAPAASVRSQAESFNSSGAVGSTGQVTHDPSLKSRDRIYRESAGAIRAEKGSNVNPTMAGEERIYRETKASGQILNESAGAELKSSKSEPAPPKANDAQLPGEKSGVDVNSSGQPAVQEGAKKPGRANREIIFPPLPER